MGSTSVGSSAGTQPAVSSRPRSPSSRLGTIGGLLQSASPRLVRLLPSHQHKGRSRGTDESGSQLPRGERRRDACHIRIPSPPGEHDGSANGGRRSPAGRKPGCPSLRLETRETPEALDRGSSQAKLVGDWADEVGAGEVAGEGGEPRRGARGEGRRVHRGDGHSKQGPGRSRRRCVAAAPPASSPGDAPSELDIEVVFEAELKLIVYDYNDILIRCAEPLGAQPWPIVP